MGEDGVGGEGLSFNISKKSEFISTQTRGGLILRCIFVCLQVDGPILRGGDSIPCRHS